MKLEQDELNPSEQGGDRGTPKILRAAIQAFHYAAFATWAWTILIIWQTVVHRDYYGNDYAGILGVSALIVVLGYGMYRGSRICIFLVGVAAAYNWANLYKQFSWPEWVFAILFAAAICAGFIGAIIYHRRVLNAS